MTNSRCWTLIFLFNLFFSFFNTTGKLSGVYENLTLLRRVKENITKLKWNTNKEIQYHRDTRLIFYILRQDGCLRRDLTFSTPARAAILSHYIIIDDHMLLFKSMWLRKKKTWKRRKIYYKNNSFDNLLAIIS